MATAAISTLSLHDALPIYTARTGGRGGARGGFAGGGASRPGFAMHHHRGRAVFFVGAPFLFWSWPYRSEEHTSELQSLRHLVCRLLLEKKKISLYIAV